MENPFNSRVQDPVSPHDLLSMPDQLPFQFPEQVVGAPLVRKVSFRDDWQNAEMPVTDNAERLVICLVDEPLEEIAVGGFILRAVNDIIHDSNSRVPGNHDCCVFPSHMREERIDQKDVGGPVFTLHIILKRRGYVIRVFLNLTPFGGMTDFRSVFNSPQSAAIQNPLFC